MNEARARLKLQRFVVERVMALDEPLRTLVILRYYDGLDNARIGEVTGMPAGTVRRRLGQAVDRLREELDEHHTGNSSVWLALLAPPDWELPPTHRPAPPTTRARALLLSLVGLALLVVTGGALWWWVGSVLGLLRL